MKTLTREEAREVARKEKDRLRKQGVKGKDEYWGTKDELRYLKTIGTHTVYSPTQTAASRKIHLRRYAKATENRIDWGPIDPQIIKDYLMLELGVKV
jgi:hypothetical protein